MGSSRLPGKVLKKIGKKTALERLFDRLKNCHRLDSLILATTTKKSDDILEQVAQKNGIECFRGDEKDVLSRVLGAHQKAKSDLVVEVTGDCPLLDPEVIDLGVDTFLRNTCDVVTNCLVPSYPQGIDVQVFRVSDLKNIGDKIQDPKVREHVSLYFYENPDKYNIVNLVAPRELQAPNLRLQLDYLEDLKLIRKIYKNLEPRHGSLFGLQKILTLLKDKPSLQKINRNCQEKPARK